MSHYLDARISQDTLLRKFTQVERDDSYVAENSWDSFQVLRAMSIEMLEAATPILVERWVCDALADAASSLVDSANEAKMVLRESDVFIPFGYAKLESAALQDIWWAANEAGVVVCYRHANNGLGISSWRYDESVIVAEELRDMEGKMPTEEDIRQRKEVFMFAYALWNFMAQKITSVERRQLPRQLRRHAPKHIAERGVLVIVLRRVAHAKLSEPSDGHSPSVRFSVRGHWRNHWYPSENRHKPLFIEAHIKGPEGAPLRLKSPIVSVSR